MTPQEYAQKFKQSGPVVSQEEEVAASLADDWKPKITVINSSEEEMFQEEMKFLAAGGADYGGREQLIGAMQRLGR